MFFLRSAMKADLPAIQHLLRESWMTTYAQRYGEDKIRQISQDWHSLTRLGAQLDCRTGEFVLADNGRTIGGMAYAVAIKNTEVELKQLHIDPELKGQGIGTDLLVEIEAAFPDARRFVLDVDPENRPAISFYEKHGYRAYGKSDCCGDGYDLPALKMEKHVSAGESKHE